MMPLFTAMDAATPPSTPPAGIRPEPAVAGGMTARMSRLDRKASPSGASFQEALRAAGADSRPESTEGAGDSGPAPEVEGPDRGPSPASFAEGQTEVAAETEAGAVEGDRVDAVAAASAALQGVHQAAVQPVVADPVAAGAESVDEGDGRAASELLDLLKEIQAAQEALGPGGEANPKLAQLVEALKTAADAGGNPAALPGKIHQLLRDLREHLSGIAWGRAVRDVAPQTQDTAGQTAMTQSTADSRSTSTDAGAAVAPALRAEPVQANELQDLPPAAHAGFRKTGDGERTSGADAGREAASENETAGQPVRVPAGAVRTVESIRPVAQRQDTPAAPGATPTVSEPGRAEFGTTPAGADSLPEMKPVSGESLPPAETADSGPPGETAPPVDARAARLPETRPEHALETGNQTGKDKEAAGTTRAGVYDQIVQKAVLQVKNGQSEIKIDLKPEFLGNVRMQIVTENQQVSVRILTEAPAVRDMIETGLQQLRSELQNQGLQVDRLEVAVSEDYREPRQRQGKPGERARDGRLASLEDIERTGASDRMGSVYFRQPPSARRSTVDMFV
jgi:flagellar hook-length control protein FliK